MNLKSLDLYLDYAEKVGISDGEARRFIAGFLVIHGASHRVANLVGFGDESEDQDNGPVELMSREKPKELVLPGSRQDVIQRIEAEWESDAESEDPLAKDGSFLDLSYSQMERYGDNNDALPLCSSSNGTC